MQTLTTSTESSSHEPEIRTLQCMEVWGGNQAVSTSLAMPGLDVWLFSRPHADAEGGGDVHYASSCAAGAISRMLLADVSGHGQAVASIARRLRKLMQRHINQTQQTRFVRAMNQEFATLAQNAGGGRFATAVAYTYEAPANRLEVCVAGHPPPLVYRKHEQAWSFLHPPESQRSTNIPLGIDDVVDYDEFQVDVKVGDLIMTYTDALPEARVGETDRLEYPGLLDLMKRVDPNEPAKVIDRVIEAVQSKARIEDDLTVLLFRPNGTRPFVPLKAMLMAPFRYVRAVAKSCLE